jgi:hypothetical protein
MQRNPSYEEEPACFTSLSDEGVGDESVENEIEGLQGARKQEAEAGRKKTETEAVGGEALPKGERWVKVDFFFPFNFFYRKRNW